MNIRNSNTAGAVSGLKALWEAVVFGVFIANYSSLGLRALSLDDPISGPRTDDRHVRLYDSSSWFRAANVWSI